MNNLGTEREKRSMSDQPANNESLRNWLALASGLLVVVITAGLFAAGRAYRDAYFYQLGMDLALVPSDFYDTLYWGFVHGTPIAIAWLMATAIVLLGLAFLRWLFAKLSGPLTARWPRLQARRGNSERATHKSLPNKKLMAVAILILPAVYGLGMTYFLMSQLEAAGRAAAVRLLDQLRVDSPRTPAKTRLQWIEIRHSSTTSNVDRGYRLACTPHLCAIYDPDPNVQSVRLIALRNFSDQSRKSTRVRSAD